VIPGQSSVHKKTIFIKTGCKEDCQPTHLEMEFVLGATECLGPLGGESLDMLGWKPWLNELPIFHLSFGWRFHAAAG
jgi:hypothetical protein